METIMIELGPVTIECFKKSIELSGKNKEVSEKLSSEQVSGIITGKEALKALLEGYIIFNSEHAYMLSPSGTLLSQEGLDTWRVCTSSYFNDIVAWHWKKRP